MPLLFDYANIGCKWLAVCSNFYSYINSMVLEHLNLDSVRTKSVPTFCPKGDITHIGRAAEAQNSALLKPRYLVTFLAEQKSNITVPS